MARRLLITRGCLTIGLVCSCIRRRHRQVRDYAAPLQMDAWHSGGSFVSGDQLAPKKCPHSRQKQIPKPRAVYKSKDQTAMPLNNERAGLMLAVGMRQ